VKGNGMVMRANIVVMITKDITKDMSLNRLYLNGFTGSIVSAKVKYLDCVCILIPSVSATVRLVAFIR
jgi:hypothetical protein